jgi:Rrf2 family protein
MYMVRHTTDLPVTTETIARSEGIPASYLAKVCRGLAASGFIKSVTGHKRGYTFARPADEISLLELLEAVEGYSLFGDCPLRNCECGGTPDNCRIYAVWKRSTHKIRELLAETSVEASAWNHPEHRFDVLPEISVDEQTTVKKRSRSARMV